MQCCLRNAASRSANTSSEFGPARDQAMEFLLGIQNPNGSWPAFVGDDRDGSWATALVLIAMSDNAGAILQRLKGFEWLMESAGEESHWLWKWKFRTTDRHVRFDPAKFGWPWIPHTNSWVVPTAFSILALNQLPCACGIEGRDGRVKLGFEMLLDRACPSGGWNAGNGVVYGVELSPHPDDTAIALLALTLHAQETIVRVSLDWLESRPHHQRALEPSMVDSLVEILSHLPGLDRIEDTATLAIVCLALDHPRALAHFGVIR